jgi:hypothetical protein
MTIDPIEQFRREMELLERIKLARSMGLDIAFLRSQFPDISAEDFEFAAEVADDEIRREAQDVETDEALRAWQRDVL